MTGNVRDAIYEYLDRGWSIIPICANDKTPLVKWKKFQTRQPTEDEIDFWLEKWPDMLIAVVCGAISGIIVVDADNPDAQQAALDQGFDSPVMVQTKRGRHWYFKHPLDGVHRGPQSGSGSKGEVWPQINGLDFRGDGSYALLPPSTHYTWDILNDHDHDDMPLYQDWRPSKTTNTKNKNEDFDFANLDLTQIRTGPVDIWQETADRAALYPSNLIPRGGSGIYDTTFRYLGQQVAKLGLGDELERAGREFMRTFFTSPLEEPRYQQNLKTIREKEKLNHPDRFDKDGNYIAHLPQSSSAPDPKVPERIALTEDDADTLIKQAGDQQFFMSPILRQASILQIYGYSGHGKSWITQLMLYHACRGIDFGPFKAEAVPKVLYCDWENGRSTLGAGLKSMRMSFGSSDGNYNVWTPFINGTEINLRNPDGRKELFEWIKAYRPDVLVIDTIRSAFPGIAENSSEEWATLNQLCLKLRNHGISVILLHHANKPTEHGVGREAGSSNQLTVIETQVRVTQVFEDKDVAKTKGGIWQGDYSDQNVFHSLRRKAPKDGTIRIVLEIRYGKVREWSDLHDHVQWVAIGERENGTRFVVGSMAPVDKARSMANQGSSVEAIMNTLGRPRHVIEKWIAQ
ncbi:bifunctional DNA primase/polymerase [Endozoicomonas atrinae]|uniref:bifunctional DNA primase/polymerase n=1 Tax=Endozoicomonas atrinae TaxID=1333660 RepID=UPI0009F43AEE|nr:bifunctional DNA primase/polymerase [Endozoicomonas atrinae]